MEKLNLPAFAGGKNNFEYKFTKASKGDTCVRKFSMAHADAVKNGTSNTVSNIRQTRFDASSIYEQKAGKKYFHIRRKFLKHREKI